MSVNGVHASARSFNTTALHWAVSGRNVELVRALLAEGADANIKRRDTDTTVLLCIQTSTPGGETRDIEVLSMLVDSGGSVNEAGFEGNPALFALVTRS